jgi:hypothetical protein
LVRVACALSHASYCDATRDESAMRDTERLNMERAMLSSASKMILLVD